MHILAEVVDIPDADLRPICKMLPVEALAKALKDAPEQLVDKFMKNMSLAPARLIRSLMENNVGLPAEDIESARQEIIGIIARMRAK